MNLNIVKDVGLKAYFKLCKVSPELALAGGIACGVAAVVLAVARAKDVNDVVEDARIELDDIKETAAKEQEDNDGVVSEETKKDIRKRTWKAFNKMVWRIAKILAPVIGLEAASIALYLLSHGILKKRYLNTTAALASLTEAFNGYRERVRGSIGEEDEKLIASGAVLEKGIKVEDDDGTVTKRTGKDTVINYHKNSPYEFDFNHDTAPLTWSPNPDYTEAFLRSSQNYFNDLLLHQGHVFLNEVLDHLGMVRTPAGAVCGWYKGAGDDYIDFGYMDSFLRDYRIDSDLCRKNIHLNFNVDGPIWDMI